MKLRNVSHKTDGWILVEFHWVRKQMGVTSDTVRLLVTKTRGSKNPMSLLEDLLYVASWRGRFTGYLGWGNKIMVKVTDGGRGESMMWRRAFAHELCHAIGGSESECKDAEDWIEKRWRKWRG